MQYCTLLVHDDATVLAAYFVSSTLERKEEVSGGLW